MAFSSEDQARLGEIYAPTLFLSSNDIAPVSPAEYIRRSALWSYPGPLEGPFGTETDNQTWVAPTAELMPGRLAASEDDPGTLLWGHLSDNFNHHFFLDHGGWDEHGQASVQPLPEVGAVTGTNRNLMGSIGQAIGRWNPRGDGSELDEHIGWYSVQAFDTIGDRLELQDKLALREDPASEQVAIVLDALEPSWLVFYHFFFPARWKRVSLCELQRQLWTIGELGLDISTTDGIFPEVFFPEFGYPYSFEWASYLGNFISLAVVVPAPSPVPNPDGTLQERPRPQDLDDDEFEPPSHVGFGRSVTGLEIVTSEHGDIAPSTDLPVDFPRMLVASAQEIQLDGNHPRVFVSEGNHNLYPQPGEFSTPGGGDVASICRWVDDPREVGASLGSDIFPSNSLQLLAALMKFSTMGIFGALWSLAAERRAIEPVEGEFGGALPDGTRPDDAEQDPEGLVLTAEDLVDTFTNGAGLVRPWAGATEERVFDERWDDPWKLSWGPPAMQDPFRLRQGRPFPLYIGPFIAELGAHLERQ